MRKIKYKYKYINRSFIPVLVSALRSAGERVSRGFFLAFMMLGSVAYLGSFRRRSHVTMAGRFTEIVSRPASISRVTCQGII